MSFRKPGLAALAAAVVAAGLSTAPREAGAQGLFDTLFGGQVRRERNYPPPPPPSPAKPKKVAKISAPSYYEYRADSLVRVDFAGLPATTQTASLEPMLDGRAFAESLVHLAGYELFAEKEIAKAVVDHYAAHPDFLFVSGFDANERASEVLRVLADAGRYGLDPADYAVHTPSRSYSTDQIALRMKEMMRFEMALAARVLRYASDAHRGRINPNRLSGYHDFASKPMDMAATLQAIGSAGDVKALLATYHPKAKEYSALQVELEALERTAENDIVVDAKLFMRPGDTNPEFPKLLRLIDRKADEAFRKEHGPLMAAWWNSQTYDKALAPMIKAAQEAAGLKGDGVIGPRSVEAFAGVTRADRIAKVEIALEQLRWLPDVLGDTQVFINQPAFMATYREDGRDKLSMRVVIGTPANQTTFFNDEIEQVDYNPYWGVPQSILVNEMLPRLRNDPGYLDRAGYEVTDAKGRRIPSSAVDWGQFGSKVPFNVRQTPSEANALGELKILFPNKHAIYMHDTPQKKLFERDTRAYSHGCIRLSDPRAMAAAVLGKSVDYVADKIRRGHSSEKVTRKIPVYVAYFTAWPDQAGKVGFYGDVYGRDARVKVALDRTRQVRQPTG